MSSTHSKRGLLSKKELRFVDAVWEHYRYHGRHMLPWRTFQKSLSKKAHAYRILVSEIMLQQTQVDRVIPKYKSFLKHFPTITALAKASLGEVLREWQGLGYNRRAKMLHECARIIEVTFCGRIPASYAELTALPGVGPYTAGALMTFVHNAPIPIIETNIRSVFIHHFFQDKTNVSDAEIFQLVERTLDRSNPREWYYALMDYGAFIKRVHGNPNNKSKHHAPQSKFKGSDREIRGSILRMLAHESCARSEILRRLSFEDARIDVQLQKLCTEGLISIRRSRCELPR